MQDSFAGQSSRNRKKSDPQFPPGQFHDEDVSEDDSEDDISSGSSEGAFYDFEDFGNDADDQDQPVQQIPASTRAVPLAYVQWKREKNMSKILLQLNDAFEKKCREEGGGGQQNNNRKTKKTNVSGNGRAALQRPIQFEFEAREFACESQNCSD